jgi:phosphoenolpyruvate carboxykinase (ATP)
MITTVPGQGSLEGHGIESQASTGLTVSQLYMPRLRGARAYRRGGPPSSTRCAHRTLSNDSSSYRTGSSAGSGGATNAPITEEHFERLRERVASRLGEQDVYVVDAFAGADPAHRLAVRVVTESPWHALFAKTLFIDPTGEELEGFEPRALVLHAPSVTARPDEDGTRSETFVLLHPSRLEVVIGGTFYAGEIKKSIFTLMNDRLPLERVLPMHCSANVDDDGRVAVFFGLSGTGKTTLSADPERHLIGDDEHGWSDDGIFNIEGGCYAKVIRLSPMAEPEIHRTTRTFGTVLENVVVDEQGVLDLDDDSKTENTRGAYKLERIANALPAKRGGHPTSVVFLAADAFGILPRSRG